MPILSEVDTQLTPEHFWEAINFKPADNITEAEEILSNNYPPNRIAPAFVRSADTYRKALVDELVSGVRPSSQADDFKSSWVEEHWADGSQDFWSEILTSDFQLRN